MTDPLLVAIENLSRFHRDHERFYAQAPRDQAVTLQRHARALGALADRWSAVEVAPTDALNPYEGSEDLNAAVARPRCSGTRSWPTSSATGTGSSRTIGRLHR